MAHAPEHKVYLDGQTTALGILRFTAVTVPLVPRLILDTKYTHTSRYYDNMKITYNTWVLMVILHCLKELYPCSRARKPHCVERRKNREHNLSRFVSV